MFYKLFFAITIVLLLSCNREKENFKISGTFSDLNETPVKLYLLGSANKILLDSSISSENGRFELSGNIESPAPAELRLSNRYSVFLIISKDSEIKITGNIKNIRSGYYVKGSYESERIKNLVIKQNKMLDELSLLIRVYRDSLTMGEVQPEVLLARRDNKKNAIIENYQQFTFQFIEENPSSLANIFALYQYIDPTTPVIDIKTHFKYFAMVDSALVKTYPNCESVIELNQHVTKAKEENMFLNIGTIAPELALPDTSGDTITLSSFKGKYALLYFWASWNQESIKQNTVLKNIRKEFKPSKLEIIGVSLDKSRNAWINAIKNDSLNWTHISDLMFWDSKIVPLYQVNALPLNYIIDPNGKIIAKDIYDKELFKTLKEVLN